MIRIDAVWMSTEPLDMRAGADTALARVVQVFGAAHPHHAYLVVPAKPLQPALTLVIWGESGWSELSNRYSMEPVFWEFLKAAP